MWRLWFMPYFKNHLRAKVPSFRHSLYKHILICLQSLFFLLSSFLMKFTKLTKRKEANKKTKNESGPHFIGNESLYIRVSVCAFISIKWTEYYTQIWSGTRRFTSSRNVHKKANTKKETRFPLLRNTVHNNFYCGRKNWEVDDTSNREIKMILLPFHSKCSHIQFSFFFFVVNAATAYAVVVVIPGLCDLLAWNFGAVQKNIFCWQRAIEQKWELLRKERNISW